MTIIGVAGTNGSGKDTLGDLLSEEFGFVTVSLSDVLRAELTAMEKPHSRENLSNHSKLIRDKEGDGAMAQRTIDAHKYSTDRLCITSLRAPGEVDVIHEHGGFVFWIDADPKVRYERVSGRARDQHTDVISYEEFLKQQQDEMKPSKRGGGLHLAETKEKSDMIVQNEFSSLNEYIEHLKKCVKEVLGV